MVDKGKRWVGGRDERDSTVDKKERVGAEKKRREGLNRRRERERALHTGAIYQHRSIDY